MYNYDFRSHEDGVVAFEIDFENKKVSAIDGSRGERRIQTWRNVD